MGHNSKQKMRRHILRTLDAANRSVAHLTLPRQSLTSANRHRIDSYYYTYIAVWNHMALHFYKNTLNSDLPKSMKTFSSKVFNKP